MEKKVEKELSKADRCCRLALNISMLCAFIFFLMAPVLHTYSSSKYFALPPSTWKLISYFTDFFIAVFAAIFVAASITILTRFYVTRRLCRVDNCSYYIFTVGIFVLSLIGLEYIR